jgi:1,2-phenylacetyl-CoA epoxidase PaaB subunit
MANRGAQRRYEELVRDLKRAPLRFALVQASERRPLLRKARDVYRRRTWITERLSGSARRR